MAGALVRGSITNQFSSKPKKNHFNIYPSGPATHPLHSYPDIVSGETSAQSLVAGRHRVSQNSSRTDGQRQPTSDVITEQGGLSVFSPLRETATNTTNTAVHGHGSQSTAATATPNLPPAPTPAPFGGLQLSSISPVSPSSPSHQNFSDHRSSRSGDENNVRLLDGAYLPPFPMQGGTDVDLVTSSWNPSEEPMLGRAQPIRTQDLNPGIYSPDSANTNEILPDILNSHIVSRPVALSRPNQHRSRTDRSTRTTRSGDRSNNAQQPRNTTNQSSSRQTGYQRSRTSVSRHSDQNCKAPCLKCLTTVTSFKYVLILLSMFGVCCVITGIVLAALHAVGSSFLFLSIMFLGLGLLLVIAVLVGWKFTPRGHEPLHLLFGLGEHSILHHVRSHGILRSREGYWHGGIMYPEFQYRRPPPSYDVSMQEYQQQLMQQYQQSINNVDNYSLPSSPPPTYRSRASTIRTGVHIVFPPDHNENYPNSLPPTYRSQTNSRPHLPRAGFGDEEEGYPIPEPIDPAPRDSLVSDAVSVIVASNSMETSATLTSAGDCHLPLSQQVNLLNEPEDEINDQPMLFSGRSQGTMTDPEGLLNPPSPSTVMDLTSASAVIQSPPPSTTTTTTVQQPPSFDQLNDLCNQFTMPDNMVDAVDHDHDNDITLGTTQAGTSRTLIDDTRGSESLAKTGTDPDSSNGDVSRQSSPEQDDSSPLQTKIAAETSL